MNLKIGDIVGYNKEIIVSYKWEIISILEAAKLKIPSTLVEDYVYVKDVRGFHHESHGRMKLSDLFLIKRSRKEKPSWL